MSRSGVRADGTPYEEWHVRLPLGVAEALRRHAFERRITNSKLVCDALTVWTILVTPLDHPLFRSDVMGVAFPALPADIPPGYLRSLGYEPEVHEPEEVEV